MKRRDSGMTLIELVAAMAVFAVVAIMAVQALSGTLRARDRLVTLQDDAAALVRPLTLLRNDLVAAVPLAFYPPGRGAPRSPLRMPPNGTLLEISVAGQVAFGASGNLQQQAMRRVEWRLEPETRTVYRRVWRALNPLEPSAVEPEVPVMTGVSAITVQSHWSDGRGWRPGVAGQPRPVNDFDGDTVGLAAVFSTQLPDAIEILLTTEAHGDIRILETFQ